MDRPRAGWARISFLRVGRAAFGVALLEIAIASQARGAHAGEQLRLEELAARSDGVVVVHVDLGGKTPAKSADVGVAASVEASIILLRAVTDNTAKITPTRAWFGLCLPSARLLRLWLREKPHWPAQSLWRKALAVGGYDAVAFLKGQGGAARPYCEVEAMQMQQTSLAPAYATYLAKATATFASRAMPAVPARR